MGVFLEIEGYISKVGGWSVVFVLCTALCIWSMYVCISLVGTRSLSDSWFLDKVPTAVHVACLTVLFFRYSFFNLVYLNLALYWSVFEVFLKNKFLRLTLDCSALHLKGLCVSIKPTN